jgi:hypothetical protein
MSERLIPVAALPKAWVCDRSIAESKSSNPAGGHGYLSLEILSIVRSLRRVDHSSGVLLTSMVNLRLRLHEATLHATFQRVR